MQLVGSDIAFTFDLILMNPNKNSYRPQRSWAKVIFLHLSVILLTGWVGIPLLLIFF